MQEENRSRLLERLLEPFSRALTPDAARALLQIRPDEAAQSRVQELAGRCSNGELSPSELDEYQTYVHFGSILAILHAKARLFLKQNSAV